EQRARLVPELFGVESRLSAQGTRLRDVERSGARGAPAGEVLIAREERACFVLVALIGERLLGELAANDRLRSRPPGRRASKDCERGSTANRREDRHGKAGDDPARAALQKRLRPAFGSFRRRGK